MKAAISYPINQGRVINCASMTYQPELRGTILDEPWVIPVSSEELLAPYIGWEPHLVALLKVYLLLAIEQIVVAALANTLEIDRL